MPPESQPPIEELLKASAAARRLEFGEEPAMANPMRARLHEEIARLDRAETRVPQRTWLARFWPQLTAVSAVAALVFTAVVICSMKPGASIEPKLASQATALPAERSANSADTLQSLDQTPPAIASRSALAAETRADSAEAAPMQSEVFAAAPAAPSAANLSQQRFSQNARAQTERTKADKILQTFAIEQNGNEIRVVDADGSTYSGSFEAAAAGSLARRPKSAAAAAKPARAEESEPASDQSRAFRATGFNTSLQKRVVIEGNYIPNPAQPNANARAQKSESPAQVPARIIGTAKIADEAPIEIDAASVER